LNFNIKIGISDYPFRAGSQEPYGDKGLSKNRKAHEPYRCKAFFLKRVKNVK